MKKVLLLIIVVIILGVGLFFYKTSNQIIVSAGITSGHSLSDKLSINLVKADSIYPKGQAFIEIDRVAYVELKKNEESGLWEPVNAHINKPNCGNLLYIFNTCESVFLKGRVVEVNTTRKELGFFGRMNATKEEQKAYNTEKLHKIVYGIEDTPIPSEFRNSDGVTYLSLEVDKFGNVGIRKIFRK